MTLPDPSHGEPCAPASPLLTSQRSCLGPQRERSAGTHCLCWFDEEMACCRCGYDEEDDGGCAYEGELMVTCPTCNGQGAVTTGDAGARDATHTAVGLGGAAASHPVGGTET